MWPRNHFCDPKPNPIPDADSLNWLQLKHFPLVNSEILECTIILFKIGYFKPLQILWSTFWQIDGQHKGIPKKLRISISNKFKTSKYFKKSIF